MPLTCVGGRIYRELDLLRQAAEAVYGVVRWMGGLLSD